MASLDDGLSDDDVLMLGVLLVKRRKRRVWTRDTVSKRRELGEFHRLVQELKADDFLFSKYFRMTRYTFGVLLDLVGPSIYKQTTNYREPLCPEQRLAITLRFLATGDSFLTIAFSYRVGHSTVCLTVRETCEAIWKVLQPDMMPVPDKSHWLAVAQRFHEKWNFPNCIGAIDGKHIRIQAPPNSGSLYFNYKTLFNKTMAEEWQSICQWISAMTNQKTVATLSHNRLPPSAISVDYRKYNKEYFSIVLLAMVDADYKFTFVDIGNYGSSSDGGIYSQSRLGQGLQTGTLEIPEPALLPGDSEVGTMPYVAVADEAFPLKSYMMRPYPGRNLPEDKKIFNYRLSRARRISENAFGILVQKFRVFLRTINLMPENVQKVVQATCVLHNFLRNACGQQDDDQDNLLSNSINEGAIQDVHAVAGNRPTDAAIRTRDLFKNYFNSPAGEVPWQYAMVRNGMP